MAIERALIGGCLLDTRGSRAWPTLRADQFYLSKHKLIWETILDLTEKTDRPDVTLLAGELARRGNLDEAGGIPYLTHCLEDGMSAVDLRRYGAMVTQGWSERLRMLLASELMHDPSGSERMKELLAQIESAPGTSMTPREILDGMKDGGARSYLTGIKALDEKLGGFLAGTTAIIGGRTSHGKTAFACDLAYHLSTDDYGTMVDYITLEDPPEGIVRRLAANRANESLWTMRNYGVPDSIADELDLTRLVVTGLIGSQEDAVIGAVAASHADVVIVDHLQQIITHDASRNQGLERVMQRLSSLARRSGKLNLVTAQLNRLMEARKGLPMLSDLRDSGSIEQAGRQIVLLYWPSKHDPKEDPRDFMINVAKNPEGGTGVVRERWDPRSGRFSRE